MAALRSLVLKPGLCVSCGICMDVCPRAAISMRTDRKPGPEGNDRIYMRLQGKGNMECPPLMGMTFPWLMAPEWCDGCGLCEDQCPTAALAIRYPSLRSPCQAEPASVLE